MARFGWRWSNFSYENWHFNAGHRLTWSPQSFIYRIRGDRTAARPGGVLGSSGSTVRKSESPSKGCFVAQIRHALKADPELEKTFESKRELQSKLLNSSNTLLISQRSIIFLEKLQKKTIGASMWAIGFINPNAYQILIATHMSNFTS